MPVFLFPARPATFRSLANSATSLFALSLSPFLSWCFPFLSPFPFSQDHCFCGARNDPQDLPGARGAEDCYERICGNPRSNLHADGNGCISSLIPWFCRYRCRRRRCLLSRHLFLGLCSRDDDGGGGDEDSGSFAKKNAGGL